MRKLLKVLGIALLAIIIIPLIAALFIKKDYMVIRSLEIDKPLVEVFEYLVLLKNQDEYSKWSRTDPDMQHVYTGIDGTVGFVSAWESEKMGIGEQEIRAIAPHERIDFQLRFLKPFKSTSEVYLLTEAIGENKTKVKWGMNGHMPYPTNLFLLFMNMEKSIGADFDEGLQNLKEILEN
jgi:hypothetical protein